MDSDAVTWDTKPSHLAAGFTHYPQSTSYCLLKWEWDFKEILL